MFETLEMARRAVKELGQCDPNDLTDAELADAVVELDTLRNQLQAAEAQVLRSFDVRKVWAADGAKSGAAWLDKRTRAPKDECSARLRLGRHMEHMALTREAFSAGEIGAAHVRRLKGRRRQLALAPPGFAFGHHQAVAEHRLVHPQPEVLDEVFRLGDQNLLDEVRMAEEEQTPAGQSKRHHVAIGSRAVGKEPEPVGAKLGEVAVEPVSFRTC